MPELDEGRSRPRRIVLVFVDGLGWGEVDPAVNPCHSYGGELYRLPKAPSDPLPWALDGWVVPVDAVLGVDGLPQSATGQTTLLTGVNAQAELGRHLTGFPNPRLREVLFQHSLLKTLTEGGLKARFLNVFRPLFFKLPREMQRRLSATTVANLAAGNRFYDLDDLRGRQAIYQEFTNQELRDKDFDVPLFTPGEAGHILAHRTREHDFLLYEYFQTDRAGHSQDPALAHLHLSRLDEFMDALLTQLGLNGTRNEDPEESSLEPPDTLVILTSDHGNIEDLSTRSHTRRPVPLMAWGPGARELTAQVRTLDAVTPAIVDILLY